MRREEEEVEKVTKEYKQVTHRMIVSRTLDRFYINKQEVIS